MDYMTEVARQTHSRLFDDPVAMILYVYVCYIGIGVKFVFCLRSLDQPLTSLPAEVAWRFPVQSADQRVIGDCLVEQVPDVGGVGTQTELRRSLSFPVSYMCICSCHHSGPACWYAANLM